MISAVNPIIRLEALKKYIGYIVDKWPDASITFDRFFKERYAELIPGTKEYAKSVATHCYYCHIELSKTGSYNSQTATIDHFEPKSIYKTNKFVICCAHCNQSKGGEHPDKLVKRFVNSEIKGRSVWGFSGKKLKAISERIQSINNDRIWKMGPNIYYVNRSSSK